MMNYGTLWLRPKRKTGGGKRAEKAHLIAVHWHKISLYLITLILLETVKPPYTNYPIRSCFPWLFVAEGLSVSAIGSWRIGLAFRIAGGEAGKRRAEAALATSLLTKKCISLSLNVVRF